MSIEDEIRFAPSPELVGSSSVVALRHTAPAASAQPVASAPPAAPAYHPDLPPGDQTSNGHRLKVKGFAHWVTRGRLCVR